MTTIATVTGETTPDRLGRTLMHEHLVIGYPGFESHTTRTGPGDEYRINWARASQGASIVESTNIPPATDVQNLVGARFGRGEGREAGTTIFADGVRQRERFVIDLGCERRRGVGHHLEQPHGARDRTHAKRTRLLCPF